MKRIINLFGLLIITLFVFFNIERLDFETENVVDIHSYVYVIGLSLVLLIIFVPALYEKSSRWAVFVATLGYALAKLFLHDGVHPLVSGIYTYLHVTEYSFLCILALLTFRLRNELHLFTRDVENGMLQTNMAPVPTVAEASDAIKTEVRRSRHYRRPMSVLMVQVEAHSSKLSFSRLLKEMQENLVHQYAKRKLAQAIRRQLRLMDLVLEHDDESLFVLCPEIDADGAEVLLERIQDAASEVGLVLNCGAASFPEEAFTFESLVEHAKQNLATNANFQLDKGHDVSRPVKQSFGQGDPIASRPSISGD